MPDATAASFNFMQYAQYGTIGVILATLVLCGYMIVAKRRPSDRQMLALIGFFIVAILFASGTQFLFDRNGPWVFVGTVQNSTRQLYPDNSTLYAFFRIDEQLLTTEFVFYVTHKEIKEGASLPLPLLEPQPGDKTKHFAWVCFTREPNSYDEKSLASGDIQFVPHGNTRSPCGPENANASSLLVSSASAGALRQQFVQMPTTPTPIDFLYTQSVVPGLCNWRSTSPSVSGTTLVICDKNVLTKDDPGTEELKTYVVALQKEQTDTATKVSVLKKLLSLSEPQRQRLLTLPPTEAYCDNEKAYPDEQYAEPIALTLLDLARSSDRQTSALAQETIEKIQTQSSFSNFLLKGAPNCRNQWLLRVEGKQAEDLLNILRSKDVPSAEADALDVKTPDNWRTIIKPTATSNGDLYRVVAKIPSEDDKLNCLAKVYRLVNMQDGTASPDAAEAVRKEFQLLKGIANQSRTVGWYNKIFQRDLLVGAHQCGVEAVATH
jgi:hypothetical protein